MLFETFAKRTIHRNVIGAVLNVAYKPGSNEERATLMYNPKDLIIIDCTVIAVKPSVSINSKNKILY
jgi:hypothetical protein